MRKGVLGGLAAIVGGGSWLVKGGVILATGNEPPLFFALGPPPFALAALGLSGFVRDERRGARLGVLLASVSLLSSLAVGALALGGIRPGDEDEFTLANALILVSFLALLGALAVLGMGARRLAALPPALRWLPLAMGLAMFPLVLIAGALSAINERLVELAIVAAGLTWIWLGALMVAADRSRAGAGTSACTSTWLPPTTSSLTEAQTSPRSASGRRLSPTDARVPAMLPPPRSRRRRMRISPPVDWRAEGPSSPRG